MIAKILIFITACARTATAQIERKHQIKVSRNTATLGYQLPETIAERVTNIECHLNGTTTEKCNALVKSVPAEIYQRLKVLEDKIIEMERHHEEEKETTGASLEIPTKPLRVPTHSKGRGKGLPKRDYGNLPHVQSNENPNKQET